MARVIELAHERFGPINGVIHAAGTPGTGRIACLKQPDDIQSVVLPKVGGLDVLVGLLGETLLDFFVLISSINAVLGAPGLSDYSGANAVLDAFPDSKSRPECWKHVVSIDWGPWREIGMAAKLSEKTAKIEAQSYREATIAPEAGIDAFARVLSARNKRVVVVPFNLSRHVELLVKGPTGALAASDRSADTTDEIRTVAAQERPDVTSTYVPPSTEVERSLTEIWESLLGVDRIGV